MRNKDYEIVITWLKMMNEKQLIELWHDINDINAVQRICDTSYEFTETYDCDEAIDSANDISDEDDAIEVDNARRARELK